MFAVKHVVIVANQVDSDQVKGHKVETLYMGDVVTYTEGSNIAFGPLEIRKGDCLVAALWGGTAYVMNETGKTIDIYHLRSAEPVNAASLDEYHNQMTALGGVSRKVAK